MVEHAAVNRGVAGSSPASGANFTVSITATFGGRFSLRVGWSRIVSLD